MKQIDLVINNPTGLHARPAKTFVTLAKQYKSDIRVQHGEKVANAKSLISMLTLGAESGSQIRIMVDGEDEDAALAELGQAVISGLGEAAECGNFACSTAPALPIQTAGQGQPKPDGGNQGHS
jgi:phosphotransferase system HPr (HPr) family protein